MLFCVLFVCKYVLCYCHRVATQLQLNVSYGIISGEIPVVTHTSDDETIIRWFAVVFCGDTEVRFVEWRHHKRIFRLRITNTKIWERNVDWIWCSVIREVPICTARQIKIQGHLLLENLHSIVRWRHSTGYVEWPILTLMLHKQQRSEQVERSKVEDDTRVLV